MKLNAVHRKELHAQELIEFAEQEKVPVRFIEVMPVGAGKSYVGPSNEALKTELEQWLSLIHIYLAEQYGPRG